MEKQTKFVGIGLTAIGIWLIVTGCRPQVWQSKATWEEMTPPSDYVWAISPNLRWIVYDRIQDVGRSDNEVLIRLLLGEIEREGVKEVATLAEFLSPGLVRYQSGEFSPDSQKLVVVRETLGDSGLDEVWVMDVPDTRRKRVVYTGQFVEEVVWAPNGKRIAVEDTHTVYIINLQGNRVEGRLDYFWGKFPPAFSWSPDGEQIVVCEWDKENSVWVYNLSTGESREIVRYPESEISLCYPFWSPKGDYILVTGSKFERDQAQGEVRLIDPSGREIFAYRLENDTREPMVKYSGMEALWSPDGKKIVFPLQELPARGIIAMVTVPEGKWTFFSADWEHSLLPIRWAPDGKRLLVSRDGKWEWLVVER